MALPRKGDEVIVKGESRRLGQHDQDAVVTVPFRWWWPFGRTTKVRYAGSYGSPTELWVEPWEIKRVPPARPEGETPRGRP